MKDIQMKKKNVLMTLILLSFMGCGGGNSTFPMEDTTSDYKHKFINEASCSQIIDKEFITICFDYKLKGAKSVAYTLDGDLMNELNIKKRPSFYREPTLEKKYQIVTTDYTNSGYDRGHLAPDASFDWSQESLDAVYSMANIIPQSPQVNRNMWAKLEDFARDKAVELGEIDVINVVEYSTNYKEIGKNKIAVSRGFYKILYNDSEKYEACFYYSNRLNASSRNDTIAKHSVSCDEVGY